MEQKQRNKKLDFLSDLFEHSLKNNFADTVLYLGANSRSLISGLSLFVSLDVDAKEYLVFAHRKVTKGYLSSVLESIRQFALSTSSGLEPDECKIRVQPKEEFVDAGGPAKPNFILTVPVFAGGKPRVFLNFSKSGYLHPEENYVSYINLVVDFLSALWEREAKENAERRNVEKLAFVDPLTGAFNRRAFYKLFSQDMSEARRRGTPLSLVVFDVDGFKHINDSHGHSFGDMILRQITSQFRSLLREEDKIFRLGGDEFAVIMKKNKKEASLAIRRIVKEVSNSRSVRITLSGGIVEINPYKSAEVDEVMGQADKTLYLAKESGKNQILLHDEGRLQAKSDEFLSETSIERLTGDINLKLKEVAAEELYSFYLSFNKDNKENKYVYGQSTKVPDYAVLLAKELQFSEGRLQNLKLGATIYDVGMIAVPKRIVSKNVELTADEYEVIRRHTIAGGRMIQRFPVLRDALAVVLYHHEWINGQGYPFGLAGDYIPLEARIVAVADAFYAMQSNRPYRPALPVEKSISEIIKGRGIKYDPQVVEAFLTLIESNVIAPHPQ